MVIGILAAITIVAYNGIQDRARITVVSSDLNGAVKQLALYQVDAGGYPAALSDLNSGQGLKASSGTSFQYTANGSTYCVTATKGATSYKISDDAPTPSAGGCPGHGVGGVAAITNLVTNPSVETSSTNWAERWYGAGGAGSLTRTNAAALYGGYGLRKTWTTGGGGQDIGMQYVSPATAGKTYAFSAYIRSSVLTNHRPFVQWRDGTGTQIGATVNGTEVSIPINTWQRLAMTATAPANTASVVFVWGPYPSSGSPASVAGQTLDFDGMMITESASAQTYADGTSLNWVWNSTANNSTSTGPPL